MSSRIRSRSRRSASPCPLEIQSLETRQLLAVAILDTDPDAQIVIMPYTAPVVDGGTVSVTTSRAGDITLIGDDKPNQVSVEIRGTTLLIDGGAATKFRLPGQTAQPVLEVPLPATVRSITVSLSSGSDNLSLRIFSDVTVSRDVAVSLGAGEDSLTLQVTSADLNVNQNITVDLGTGNDSVHAYTSDSASILAGRDITMRAAAGNDSVLVGDGDYVSLDSLYTVEYFQSLEDNSEIPRNQRIRAGRDFSVDLGAGNDRLSLFNAESGRDLSIAAAAGSDTLIASNLRSGRNAAITDAESAALQNLTTVGSLSIRGTAANDKLSLNGIAVNRLEIDMAAGNDQLTLSENVTVKVAGNINGGTGTNTLYSGKAQPKITVRRTTQTTSSQLSLELLTSILDDMLGESGGIMPAQIVMAE
ncbi:MAG: hypothetical protein ACKO3T_19120 [Planctomycetaceae bacterium]